MIAHITRAFRSIWTTVLSYISLLTMFHTTSSTDFELPTTTSPVNVVTGPASSRSASVPTFNRTVDEMSIIDIRAGGFETRQDDDVGVTIDGHIPSRCAHGLFEGVPSSIDSVILDAADGKESNRQTLFVEDARLDIFATSYTTKL